MKVQKHLKFYTNAGWYYLYYDDDLYVPNALIILWEVMLAARY